MKETLNDDELKLLAYYRNSSNESKKKILSYVKSLSLESDTAFITYMNKRGYSKKQIKNITNFFIEHYSIDILKSIIDNGGCVTFEQMLLNNDLYSLYRNTGMSDALIYDVFNETGKNKNDVSVGKGEILSTLTFRNVAPGHGDVNIEQNGKRIVLEYKGNSGELIGHAKYTISKCNEFIQPFLSPDEYSPYYSASNLKKFLKNRVDLNSGMDPINPIHLFISGYLKKYPTDYPINDIFESTKVFLDQHRNDIFQISTYKRNSGIHKAGDLKLDKIDVSYITYILLMIDLICYQKKCKWDYLVVFESSNGPNFGRYEIIPKDIINLDFCNLYDFLTAHNIRYSTTGNDEDDTRKQAIKIKLDLK